MKAFSLRLAGIVLAVTASCAWIRAADKPAASAPDATPKPAPAWVKIIDQGDLDPRLKGYKTPEGVKVEIVAENPVAPNPTGVIVGLDGLLYRTTGAGDGSTKGLEGGTTVLRSGAVLRCRPDGSKKETFAVGLANPRGAAFDAAGNLFVVDGELADGRPVYVAEGADFGWRLKTPASQPMPKNARRSASALLIYNDTRFPENYRGLLIRTSAAQGLLHAYKVERKGATFEVAEEFDFLKSDDPLFRPWQAVSGPDGAIYVVDARTKASDNDDKQGRIYRLTWAGTKDQPALPPRDKDALAKIVKLDDDDLIKALIANEAGDAPRLELIRRGDKERPALLELLKASEQPDEARIAALSALESMWNGDVQAVAIDFLTKESSADLRRLSADALGLNAAKGNEDVHSGLLRALTDSAPEVRRSAALAMSHVAAPGAADVLVNTWAFDDGHDMTLHDGLVRAIENLGRLGVSRLVALGESGVQKETNKAVEAFTMFRTRAGADAIPRLLENPHLSAMQRIALLCSYNNYLLDPPVSLTPALEYLTNHNDPTVLKGAILGLGGDGEGARFLGQAFLDMKLPAEALPDVTEVLRRQAVKDPECAKLLTAVMKEKPEQK